MSRSTGTWASPTPELGEHTDEILADLGYDPAEIERLRREGAIG